MFSNMYSNVYTQRRCDDDCNGCFAVCCLVKIRKLIRTTNPVTEIDEQLWVAVTVITRTLENKTFYAREN